MTQGTQTGAQEQPRVCVYVRGDGEAGGRDVQVGGDMGKPIADSC